jgi:hypothetical protein
VQVIHILGNDRHPILILKGSQETMTLVRLCALELPTTLGIEVKHSLGIACPPFYRSNLLW